MKPLFKLILPIFLIFYITSCGPAQQEKSVAKMLDAQKMINRGDTLNAIGVLKSISSLFPKSKEQIEASKKIVDDLFHKMIESKKEQLSSTENQIAKFEKNFTKEKTEFDQFEQYIPNKLSFNHSWNKSFLQVTLDERGEIYLTSNYMGKDWLKHTAIKVYDGRDHVETDEVPLDNPNNRESDFLDYKWEKVSYTQGKSDSTIRFIVDNCKRKLKCAFMGLNYYYIILEDFNKEAIKDAYNLSLAIKNKNQIISQIKELEAKRY